VSPARSPVTMPLTHAATAPIALVGGKAASLGRLLAHGLPAPDGLVLTTVAYHRFVETQGLAERIAVELARKRDDDYRWEELWDAALRIRSWFLGNPWPEELRLAIERSLSELPPGAPVVVRSSSPHEDSKERSFAGMHESVVGVVGTARILDAVRAVWASLFSDRSLLYRRELGLDPVRSSMAVIVQPLAESDRSGVAFTQDPLEWGRGTVEAVWGLGEGLVSGQVAPDRWSIDRGSGRVLSHEPPEERAERLALAPVGTALVPLDHTGSDHPPLKPSEVADVWSLATRAEEVFGSPQDCEWTYDLGSPLLTQSRPITTLPDDARRAHLDLRPSFDLLARLGERIERESLPAMSREADEWGDVDLSRMLPSTLADEARLRAEAVTQWRRVYREEFIPFAHGARLFGRFYNDAVRPEDPFEFVAVLVRDAAELETHRVLLAELHIEAVNTATTAARRHELETHYIDTFGTEEDRSQARRILDLGRASWRLRDDDNLYLRRLENEAQRALREIERRLGDTANVATGDTASGPASGVSATEEHLLQRAATILRALEEDTIDSKRPTAAAELPPGVRPRQLLGQPAGPGVATGPARVIATREDLLALRPGDIVVADALEPDTAAFAARAAGIVERRGGMLVHGAIVAREHGLPCVTGVTGATTVIRSGELLTVDGYLGIVVLDDV